MYNIKILIIIYTIFNILTIHNVSGKAGDILLNNEEKWIESGKPWTLFEDYTLNITIKDRERVFISLSKTGKIVHNKGAYIESLYRYINNKTGQEIISFYIQKIESNKIQIRYIFQYSDDNSLPPPTVVPIVTPTVNPKFTYSLVSEYKTLMKNETWNIGDGWTLVAHSIDSKAKQVRLSIYNNGIKLNETVLDEGTKYNYNNIFYTNINYIYNNGNIDFVRLRDTYIDSKSIPIFIPKPIHTQIETKTSIFSLGDITEAIKSNITTLKLIILFIVLLVLQGIILLAIIRR